MSQFNTARMAPAGAAGPAVTAKSKATAGAKGVKYDHGPGERHIKASG